MDLVEPQPVGAVDIAGLRVCVVSMHYAPETTGNAPYASALARMLAESGARVRVVTGVPHYPMWQVQEPYGRGLRWEERDGVVKVSRRRHAVPKVPNLLGRARMESTFLAQVAPTIRRDDSDVIITFSPVLSGVAATLAGRRGRPVGVLVQDLTGNGAAQSGVTSGGVAQRIGAMEFAMMRRATLVGVITPRFGDVLVEHGVPPQRIVDLPNFTHIEPSPLTREQARERLGWDPAEFLVLHTGNMGMKQGLETVVEAARLADAKHSGVTFVLMGDGNQRAALEELGTGISSLRFLPFVSEEDYGHVLAAADVLLINERLGVVEMSLPSKLTSYVGARRPIVAASERDGITGRLLAEFDAAHLVPTGDPAALLEAIVAVRADAALCERLVEGATRLGHERYSADAAAARYRWFARSLADVASE